MISGYGVLGANDNCERISGLCASVSTSVANTYFTHEDVHKYLWNRHNVDKSMIDLYLVRRNMMSSVHDVRSRRGLGRGLLDHLLML